MHDAWKINLPVFYNRWRLTSPQHRSVCVFVCVSRPTQTVSPQRLSSIALLSKTTSSFSNVCVKHFRSCVKLARNYLCCHKTPQDPSWRLNGAKPLKRLYHVFYFFHTRRKPITLQQEAGFSVVVFFLLLISRSFCIYYFQLEAPDLWRHRPMAQPGEETEKLELLPFRCC